MSPIEYPETIRICAHHARPSCQPCLFMAFAGDASVAAALFHNPVRL
jgi:hypothetical protein